ncbi:hypothetical protein FB451DRAFT_1268774 [Mycena latifolia]|nr:hypothetical protein FB451DRAFT_1268774 [Mycena latifolia]
MPSFTPPPGLGPLSNREPQCQNQSTLVLDKHGRIRFAALSRRILALPPEILAEIFIHCVPDSEFVKPDINSAPLLLCGICRQFREIALSTPELWNSLSFEMGPLDAGSFDTATEETDLTDLLRSWLARARRTSLSLRLEGIGWGWRQPIMQTIVSLSPQWRNMDISLTPSLVESLLSLEGNFPSLEKLKVRSATDLPMSFRYAPKLREAHIFTYHSNIQLPGHQITIFRTHAISFPDCLAFLRDCPNLVDGIFVVIDGHSPTQPISVPPLIHLQSLIIVGLQQTAPQKVPIDVLDSLRAPALKSLVLRFPPSHRSAPSDAQPFLSFVSRSSFQLQRLVLFFAPAAAVTQYLPVLASLVHLRLEPLRIVDANAIFPQLTGNPKVLPRLESLHIILHNGLAKSYEVPVEAVIQLLRWRWATGGITQLRSFQLAHDYPAPVLDQVLSSNSEFQRLAAEGMSLCVGVSRPGVDGVGS